MRMKKPEGWREDLENFIREGGNYKEVSEKLKEKYGEEGEVSAASFSNTKKKLFPEEEREEALANEAERRKATKKKIKAVKWTAQKQAVGDKSQLASVLNQVIYYAVPCPNKADNLKIEDIQEINVGGGIVNVITYSFPNLNLNHPVLILVLRVGLLIVKVKQLCYTVRQKVNYVKQRFGGIPVTPDMKEAPQPRPLDEIVSEHPLDKLAREEKKQNEK